jgi:hypothetical protein
VGKQAMGQWAVACPGHGHGQRSMGQQAVIKDACLV